MSRNSGAGVRHNGVSVNPRMRSGIHYSPTLAVHYEAPDYPRPSEEQIQERRVGCLCGWRGTLELAIGYGGRCPRCYSSYKVAVL